MLMYVTLRGAQSQGVEIPIFKCEKPVQIDVVVAVGHFSDVVQESWEASADLGRSAEM